MVSNFVRVMVVLVSVAAAAASATSQSQGCPPGQLCGPQPAPAVPIPPPAPRTHTVVAEQPIDGLSIAAVPYSVSGWRIGVQNNGDQAVSIVWDESTFISSNGTSAGRLIRGETRRMDMSNAQPATPLPAKAKIFQIVLPEKWYEFEEIESKLAGQDSSKYDAGKVQRFRDNITKALEGGKLYVVVDVGGTKKTWIGVVTNPSSEQPAPPSVDAGVQ